MNLFRRALVALVLFDAVLAAPATISTMVGYWTGTCTQQEAAQGSTAGDGACITPPGTSISYPYTALYTSSGSTTNSLQYTVSGGTGPSTSLSTGTGSWWIPADSSSSTISSASSRPILTSYSGSVCSATSPVAVSTVTSSCTSDGNGRYWYGSCSGTTTLTVTSCTNSLCTLGCYTNSSTSCVTTASGSARFSCASGSSGYFDYVGGQKCVSIDITGSVMTEVGILDTFSGIETAAAMCANVNLGLYCDTSTFLYKCTLTRTSTPAPPSTSSYYYYSSLYSTPSPDIDYAALGLGLGVGLGVGIPVIIVVVILSCLCCGCCGPDGCCAGGSCRCCESSKRADADAMPGELAEAPHVSRMQEQAREDWPQRLKDQGINYGEFPAINWGGGDKDVYWNERASYKITAVGRAQLEKATNDLHVMCLAAVDRVVNDRSDDLMDKFEIPKPLRPAVRTAWKQRQTDMIGRFDLLWNGRDPPKMSEYNADTPTVLVECSKAQADWINDVHRGRGQFNNVHERLVNSWGQAVRPGTKIFFVSPGGAAVEEGDTVRYLSDTAVEAGYETKVTTIDQLTFDTKTRTVRCGAEVVECVWKHYPVEWLVEEELGRAFDFKDGFANCQWLEPPWKIILGNKALLALLWEMYPDHPNLLPAFYDPNQLARPELARVQTWVGKPRYGREGWGIEYFDNDAQGRADCKEAYLQPAAVTMGASGDPMTLGRSVFQAFYETPKLNGRNFVLGSWVIGGRAAGLCVREDIGGETINDNSCFVPHWIDTNRYEAEGSDEGSVDGEGARFWGELYGGKKGSASGFSGGTGTASGGGSGSGGAGSGSGGGSDSGAGGSDYERGSASLGASGSGSGGGGGGSDSGAAGSTSAGSKGSVGTKSRTATGSDSDGWATTDSNRQRHATGFFAQAGRDDDGGDVGVSASGAAGRRSRGSSGFLLARNRRRRAGLRRTGWHGSAIRHRRTGFRRAGRSRIGGFGRT